MRSAARSGFPLPDVEADPEDFRRAVLGNRLLTPLVVSRDARTTAILVDLTADASRPEVRDDAIDAAVAAARDAGLDPLVTGIPAVRGAYSAAILYSLTVLPPIVVVLLAAILWLAVRRWLPVVGLLLGDLEGGAAGLALGTFVGAAEAWRRFLDLGRAGGSDDRARARRQGLPE